MAVYNSDLPAENVHLTLFSNHIKHVKSSQDTLSWHRKHYVAIVGHKILASTNGCLLCWGRTTTFGMMNAYGRSLHPCVVPKIIENLTSTQYSFSCWRLHSRAPSDMHRPGAASASKRYPTPGYAGYNVAWSPFFPDRLAVASSANVRILWC